MIGTSLRVHFKALESALFDQDLTNNNGGLKVKNGGLAVRILNSLKINKYITLQQISESLKVSKRAVEREIRKLQNEGVVSREGGTRWGYWQINNE